MNGFGEAPHTDTDIPWLPEMPVPPRAPTGPSPLGAGCLILVSRELSGLPQATLATRRAVPRSRRPAGSGVRAPRHAASERRRRPGRPHGPAQALPARGATL